MKIRSSFVSNSSSTSFIIENLTNNNLSLVDFVKENPQLVEAFNSYYDYDFSQDAMISAAEKRNTSIPANTSEVYTFGDGDGDVIGEVFDYILRDGGESESFKWYFNSMNR